MMFKDRARRESRMRGFMDALIIGSPDPVNMEDVRQVAYDHGFDEGQRAVERIANEVATRVERSEPAVLGRAQGAGAHTICSCGHSIDDHFATGCAKCWCREFWSGAYSDRASSGALRALADSVYERFRRGPQEDDARRSVCEEPQRERRWQMEFRRSQAGEGRTISLVRDAASTSKEAELTARYRHDLEGFRLHRGLSPDGEPFGPESEGDDIVVPRPEDTPSDVAKLAVEEARDPSLDDEPQDPDLGDDPPWGAPD